ncbi:hypothetical protein C7M84_024213 [Penaeus vannamei]|uniref:Uncharacterized protein n=1 Tax=Penaeus vannamei TaxID=6689 RepID=A0A3R7MIJ0_PENVA|nr:hypothetical protein C7M84_024213 [Penaeus vannamei]
MERAPPASPFGKSSRKRSIYTRLFWWLDRLPRPVAHHHVQAWFLGLLPRLPLAPFALPTLPSASLVSYPSLPPPPLHALPPCPYLTSQSRRKAGQELSRLPPLPKLRHRFLPFPSPLFHNYFSTSSPSPSTLPPPIPFLSPSPYPFLSPLPYPLPPSPPSSPPPIVPPASPSHARSLPRNANFRSQQQQLGSVRLPPALPGSLHSPPPPRTTAAPRPPFLLKGKTPWLYKPVLPPPCRRRVSVSALDDARSQDPIPRGRVRARAASLPFAVALAPPLCISAHSYGISRKFTGRGIVLEKYYHSIDPARRGSRIGRRQLKRTGCRDERRRKERQRENTERGIGGGGGRADGGTSGGWAGVGCSREEGGRPRERRSSAGKERRSRTAGAKRTSISTSF